MFSPDQQTVADRVVFSPAERAVLVEQLESLKVTLEHVVTDLKDGTAAEVLNHWIAAHAPWDYAHDMISRKISTALYDIAREQGDAR